MGPAREGATRNLWTREEDQMLRQAVSKNGFRWVKVAKLVPSRTAGACSERWKNHLDPLIVRPSRVPFSQFETAVVYKGQQSLGNSWAKIAKHLPGRTNDHVKGLCESFLSKGYRVSDNKFMDFTFEQLVSMSPHKPGQDPEQLPSTDQPQSTACLAQGGSGASGGLSDPSSPVIHLLHNSRALYAANMTDGPVTPCHGHKRAAPGSDDSPDPATYKRYRSDSLSLAAEHLQNNSIHPLAQFNRAVQCVTPSGVHPGALDPMMSLPRIATGMPGGLACLGYSLMQAHSPTFNNHMAGTHSPAQRVAAAAVQPLVSPSNLCSFTLQQMLRNQMQLQQHAVLLQQQVAAQAGGLCHSGLGASDCGYVSPFAAAQGQGFGVLMQRDSVETSMAWCSPARQGQNQQQEAETQMGHQQPLAGQVPGTGSASPQAAPAQGFDRSVLPGSSMDLGLMPFPSVNLVDILELELIDDVGLEATVAPEGACQAATCEGMSSGALHMQPGRAPAAGSMLVQHRSSSDRPQLSTAGSMPCEVGVDDIEADAVEELLLSNLLGSQGDAPWWSLVDEFDC